MGGEREIEAVLREHRRVPGEITGPPRVEFTYEDFEKHELLGTGGTATVYRATVDRPEGETVALKELHDDVFSESFEREAELWPHLDHDYIIDVIDWGTEPRHWIALEYADGGTLADHIQQHSLEQSLWVGICLARGLRYAHERGVVHLDLKPENVLFRQMPGDVWDVPKITDLGLAKLLLTDSGDIEGLSYHYAAPEQVRPDEFGTPDQRTDIYQIGGVVYALLTGVPPVAGSRREMVGQTVAGDIEPPSSVNSSLPRSLDVPILTALETRPADRYEDILQLRKALERAFLDIHAIEETRQKGVDNRRTGRVAASGPTTTPDSAWVVDDTPILTGPPAVLGDDVFVTTRDGTVHVVSVHSGAVTYEVTLSDTALTAPVLRNNCLYTADRNGTVYAVPASDDQSGKRLDVQHTIHAPPLVAGDTVVVTTADGLVLALTLPETPRWERRVPGNVHAAGALSHDRVIVPTFDGIAALGLETGRLEWQHSGGAPFRHPPTVFGETVYAGGRKTVVGLDITSGDRRWEQGIDGGVTGMAVTPDACYVSTDTGVVLSLDRPSGSERWRSTKHRHEFTGPVVGTDALYVGCSGSGRKTLPARMNDVYAFELESGRERWSYATDSEVPHTPVIAGDTLLVVDTNGVLYALA